VGGFEFRWVGKLLEIVFVRSVPHVHFGLETVAAFRTGLPVPIVFLIVVESTKGEADMVAPATIAGVREHDILVSIITDPLTTTRGLGELTSTPAQSAFAGW
jgi:hypothetical protein